MLLARAARASRGASGLPALTGGAARVLCTPSHHPDVHIHPEMPDKWRRLSECRGPHARSCDARHLTWRLTHPCAAYPDLEVWDTAELKQLESQMLEMEKSLSALRAKAVAENRPVRTHALLPTCTVARRGAWRVNCGTASHGVAWRGAWLPARAWRGRLVE